LNEYGGDYIDKWPNPVTEPQDPPDGRVTDDQGGGVPYWLDIHFMKIEDLYGPDPALINSMKGSTWRSFFNGSLNYPDDPIRVYK